MIGSILKKFLLLLSLISSLYSDAKFYLGANYGLANESFPDIDDATNQGQYLTAKIGYGERDAYAIEFSLDYLENNSAIFSDKDGDKIAFNIELVKAFDFDIYVNPFVKVGFGAGFLQIEREMQDNLSYGSFNAALGVYIPLSEDYDIELGYIYRNNSYQDIDMVTEEISYQSHTNAAYAGFNIRF